MTQKPILLSERMVHKDYNRNGTVAKKNDIEPQGSSCKDKLIGGKPPVVK
jgi:hypothetical protein